MYGGKMPGELPRNGYFFGRYRDGALMLAERLHAHGVRTMAAHAHFYFSPGGAGLDQGFDEWQLLPGLVRNNTTDVEVTSDRLAPLVQQMLQRANLQPRRWFLHTHFMDPHDVYKRHPASPVFSHASGARAAYLAEVWFTDQHVGRLLDWVAQQSWASSTAIIVSADHGEMFGEHHHFRHGFYLWEELVRVPWIVVVPGAVPRVIDVPRSHLDLAPTIMDLMGVPAASDLRGVSLRDEIEGAVAQERPVWIDLPQTSDNDRWRARIDGYIKAVSHGDNDATFSVYNLLDDPEELHPLARENPARIQAVEAFRRERSQWHDVAPDSWHPH
jgi:arylsulfatase A-like enzyme